MSRQKLSAAQRQELEDLVKTTREVKLYRRAKVILYKEAGYSAEEIEVHTDYSEREQWWWLARYRQEGVKGLSDRPRCGRPRQAPPAKPASGEPAKRPPLEEWARLTLEQMHAHHPKPYLRERAQLVLLHDKGYSEAAIGAILGVQVRTVRQVLANYERQGLGGLYRQPGSGRPAKLAGASWEQVSAWVKQGPSAWGYRFVKWTTRSLRACIDKKWNVRLSRERIRQQLHRFIGYTWTRGKKVPAPRDPAKWQRERQAFCQRMLKWLEQAAQGQIILLFEDETIFTLAGEVGYSWSPRGTTQPVPSRNNRDRLVVFGAADPITGQTHSRLVEDSINQESTLEFIKQLVRYYHQHQPAKPLVIVLDRHPGHTARSIDNYVQQQDHLTLENTPAQSADLNPIEHLWHWLSEQMIKNAFFVTLAELKRAVRHFFSYIAALKARVRSWLGDLRKLYYLEGEI